MAQVLLLPLQSTRRTESLNLSLLNPRILLCAFQLYAVEKWLVDRSRPLTLLAVYTGHQHHVLPVAAYTTPDQPSWDRIISFLKRDGARQRETEHGYIMVTSLAHFRSDYTIVQIPDGDFPAHRDHLFANVNLLRMNCSGRSALTLEEPSDSTKDRFISTYLIPDVSLPYSRTRDRSLSTATVLELIKLIQAGLSLFGMYSGPLDGLLCDTTVDGIRRWIADIGEPIIGLEPTERIADPMFVSALLSLVISMRNKLSALGYGQHVPKDPFLQPQTFLNALSAFVQNTSPFAVPSISNSNNTPSSSILGHAHSFSLPNAPFQSVLAPPLPIVPRITVLNQSLIESIDAAYDSKHRPTETRKVRRAIKEKFDDIAGVVAGATPDANQDQGPIDAVRRGTQSSIDISSPGDRGGSNGLVGSSTALGGIASGLGRSGGTNGLSSMVEPTTHLARLVKLALGGASNSAWARGKSKSGKQREGKDFGVYGSGREKDKEAGVAGSVRALWGGNVNQLAKMREWQDLAIATDKDFAHSGRERAVVSEGEEAERTRPDGRTTEEESDLVLGGPSFWGERMQRTLESLTSRRGRRKTPGSIDLATSPTKGTAGAKLSATRKNAVSLSSPLNPLLRAPSIASPTSPLISDDDDLLSGQMSPPVGNSVVASPESSKMRRAKYEPSSPSRLWTSFKRRGDVGWSHSTSTRDDISDTNPDFESTSDLPYSVCRDDTFIGRKRNGSSLERRRSFHDLDSLRDMLVLTPEQMRIDVELCGQMLVMIRRQENLHNIIACMQVLESSLSTASSLLREDYESHHEFIASLDPAGVFADINGEYKKAEEISQQTKTLMYESKQFNIADLWHAANHSRQKVFELRHKVFGRTGGRRLPHGVHGAHGPFDRLQWTLDGEPRLVDIYGRTEKEVEEEIRADPYGQFSLPVQEEEDDVVEHPSIKPMWLLQLFTRWGTRWGAHAANRQPADSHDTGVSSATDLKADTAVGVNRSSPVGKSPD